MSSNAKSNGKNRENALNAHNNRVKRLKHFNQNIKKNQGKRVDKIIAELVNSYQDIDPETITSFDDFPLSPRTLEGLKLEKFKTPTDIQRQSIGLALQGHDILGAAKTGSGKTLAFLIPVLELLYRNKISHVDPLAALIISPTRELAYQTYTVLKKIGQKHDFSAGLVIGGKDLKEEKERISRTHIIICTPGRLQQHMEQTWGFSADNLLALVIDECDRILDMGFRDTLNAIVEYLPTERQTLMFSATQTKSVKDLARLGLKSPVYVSVHENADFTTPTSLEQSYIMCELHDKLNVLWFFIKNHLKSKILVFVQSAKQARYIHATFEKIRPGVSLLALHGNMKQIKRVKTYDEFCRKQFVVLFATDVAARGLDFPGVDWVVQFDAPDSVETYIHRVGRTARYQSEGEALLFLLPSEQKMISDLGGRKIPIEEIKVNPSKLGDITKKLASQLVESPELKEFAKAAFIAYIKGYFLMKNKAVFDIKQLDTDKYAQSLGLVLIPKIRFLQKQELLKKKELEARMRKLQAEQESSSEGSSSNEDALSDRTDTDGEEPEEKEQDAADSDEELLKVKADIGGSSGDLGQDKELTLQQELEERSTQKKRAISKKDLMEAMKKRGISAKKTVFSDQEDDEQSEDDNEAGEEDNLLDIEAAKLRLKQQDEEDKETYRIKVKRKHQEKRWKEKEARRGITNDDFVDDEPVAYLGSRSDESGGDDSSDDLINKSTHPINSHDTESEEEPENPAPKKKPKVETSYKSESESSHETDSELEEETSSDKLEDVEAFALKLLSNS